MARQPKLILRESAVDDVVADWPTGSFLETGAGTGYMTRKFLDKGYRGACYELSEEAREKIRANLADYTDRLDVLDSLDELDEREFDYLLTFEVLEHIEDDAAALQAWTRHLKPNGRLLLSVPAHQNKYSLTDEMVGHVRRYERKELEALLESAGYADIEIINYGFPVSEISRPLANMITRKEASADTAEASPVELSKKSSYERKASAHRFIEFVGEKPVLPFKAVQRLFYNRDWGDGIIATARKRP